MTFSWIILLDSWNVSVYRWGEHSGRGPGSLFRHNNSGSNLWGTNGVENQERSQDLAWLQTCANGLMNCDPVNLLALGELGPETNATFLIMTIAPTN